MLVAAVIIAGGRSARMGAEKAFLPLGGMPLLSHVITRLAPQASVMAINANGDPSRFSQFDLPVIGDRLTDIGTPLAGLEAALTWAENQQADLLLTAPSDTPRLPTDLCARFISAGAPAIAASPGQAHYVTGLWPVSLLPLLQDYLNAPEQRSMRRWAKACGARHVAWPALPHDPFININTPEDLAALAEQIP